MDVARLFSKTGEYISYIEDYPHFSMLTNFTYYQIFKNCCQSPLRSHSFYFSHDALRLKHIFVAPWPF